MTTRIYRAAIVGLGNIGLGYDLDERTRRRYPYATHASAYRAHPRTQLVAGCDREVTRHSRLREVYGVDCLYTEAGEMLREQSPDILSVCVPPEEQEAVVDAAILLHVPVIFCEKPFATSRTIADDLLKRARRAKSSLVVNYWRRFDGSHGEVRRLIGDGRIGTVRAVHGTYGNGLRNVGSHVLDLLLWYFGPVAWICAVEGAPGPAGDPGLDLMMEFRGGIRATLLAHDYRDYRILELDLLGSRGRVSIAKEGLEIRCYGVEENEDVSGAKQLTGAFHGIESTVGEAPCRALDYVAGVLDRAEPVFCDHAIETHRVMEAAAQSAAAGGKRVTL